MSNNAAKTSKEYKDRRRAARTAPSYPSRRGEKLVEGLSKAELVVKYTHKVRLIAAQISQTVPSSVHVDDLISVGFIGLMDAADKFDPKKGFKFETYAAFRIRGAILDELRNQDWVPRSVRDKVKEHERAIQETHAKKGRKPTDTEVSKALGVSRERYQREKDNLSGLSMIQFGDLSDLTGQDNLMIHEAKEDEYFTDPFTEVTRKDTRDLLDKMMKCLSDEERIVLSCYYYRGLNLNEIGNILALSVSRISQIHAKAILKLKEKVNEEVANVTEFFTMLLQA